MIGVRNELLYNPSNNNSNINVEYDNGDDLGEVSVCNASNIEDEDIMDDGQESDDELIHTEPANKRLRSVVSETEAEIRKLNKTELKALCRKYGLYRSGNKPLLIKRLLDPNNPNNQR